MGVGAGLYMCDVVVKSSHSLSHLLMSSCLVKVVHSKRSGMDHTVLPANNTMPAFPSWAFTRCHHHSNWGSRHPVAAHYSFMDPKRM